MRQRHAGLFLEAHQEPKQGNDEGSTRRRHEKRPIHHYFLAKGREDIPICTGFTSSHQSHWSACLYTVIWERQKNTLASSKSYKDYHRNPPNLYSSKGKMSSSWCSKIYQANRWHNLPDKSCTLFLIVKRILHIHTLLTEKHKQKLFGYKNFYLSYYLCAKTHSRHCEDRKYHCINKFYKLSHIGLFPRWRKIFLSNGKLQEKFVFKILKFFLE